MHTIPRTSNGVVITAHPRRAKQKSKIKQVPISSPNQCYVVLTTSSTAEPKTHKVPAKKIKPTAQMEYIGEGFRAYTGEAAFNGLCYMLHSVAAPDK